MSERVLRIVVLLTPGGPSSNIGLPASRALNINKISLLRPTTFSNTCSATFFVSEVLSFAKIRVNSQTS